MFIKDLYAISPQLTHNLEFEKGNFQVHPTGKILAIEPNYLEFIPAGQLRRMGKAVRMGIGAGWPLLQRNPELNGIIIGTANGGLEDCVKFLNQIVEYDEGVLTPTNFVQSTPNALAGQLALLSKNTGYNSTHVNGSLAFENALLDAQLYFENSDQHQQLLVGAVEEISEYNYNIDLLAGRYKTEVISNEVLIQSTTVGSICGEGSTMFVLSNSPENAKAEIMDVMQCSFPSEQDLTSRIEFFLTENQLTPLDIDLVLLGNNGDASLDFWYNHVATNLFPTNATYTFKQYCGDYRTASAFGVYLATQILSGEMKHSNSLKSYPKTVLVYNHFDGMRHGIILLRETQETANQ